MMSIISPVVAMPGNIFILRTPIVKLFMPFSLPLYTGQIGFATGFALYNREQDFKALEKQKAYQKWVESSTSDGEWDQSRAATQQGRVIGRQTFQKEIEAMLGRRIVGEMRERPRKEQLAVQKNIL